MAEAFTFTAGFARMIERAAGGAVLELKAHPQRLRHACGLCRPRQQGARHPGDPRPGSGIARIISMGRLHTAGAEPVSKDFWRGQRWRRAGGCRRGPNDDGDMEMAARTTGKCVNGAISATVADVGFAY